MAYPTTPAVFAQVQLGENPSPLANLLGGEITSIETALLHAAGQTTAPIRMRQGGNLIEWGPATVGKLSTLGNTNGRSFVGLGCEAGTVPGTFTTRGQKGMVLTTDGDGGWLVQAVPLAGTANQAPVTRLAVSKTGVPTVGAPVVVNRAGAVSAITPAGSFQTLSFPTATQDPYGFYTGNAQAEWKVPVGMAGLYLWILAATWPGAAAGIRAIAFFSHALVFYYLDAKPPELDGGGYGHQVVMLRHMVDNEMFQAQGLQTSGATLTPGVVMRGIKLS